MLGAQSLCWFCHVTAHIAFKRDLLCTETPELDISCEIVWCKWKLLVVGLCIFAPSIDLLTRLTMNIWMLFGLLPRQQALS